MMACEADKPGVERIADRFASGGNPSGSSQYRRKTVAEKVCLGFQFLVDESPIGGQTNRVREKRVGMSDPFAPGASSVFDEDLFGDKKEDSQGALANVGDMFKTLSPSDDPVRLCQTRFWRCKVKRRRE